MDSRSVYSTIGKVAPLYDLFSNVIGYKKSVDYFVSQLPFSKDSSFKVLDAGCGTGPYSLALLKQYKNVQITDFDLIIVSGVFEYLPMEKVLVNLSRFLESGGYFLHSPVRDNFLGKLVCKLYICKTRSREHNIEIFERNGFVLQKVLRMPLYTPVPFKEAHLFIKN